jgi:hypothetical protein
LSDAAAIFPIDKVLPRPKANAYKRKPPTWSIITAVDYR